MPIIFSSLVCTNKIQKNLGFKVRLTRMISTKTKEYFLGRYLWLRSIKAPSWERRRAWTQIITFSDIYLRYLGLPRCKNLWHFFFVLLARFGVWILFNGLWARLFSLFYVIHELDKFLHRGWAGYLLVVSSERRRAWIRADGSPSSTNVLMNCGNYLNQTSNILRQG